MMIVETEKIIFVGKTEPETEWLFTRPVRFCSAGSGWPISGSGKEVKSLEESAGCIRIKIETDLT